MRIAPSGISCATLPRGGPTSTTAATLSRSHALIALAWAAITPRHSSRAPVTLAASRDVRLAGSPT